MSVSRAMVMIVALGAGFGSSSCGGQLPGPPTGPHLTDSHNRAIVVKFPAPPVRPECLPPQPSEACVWVDGSWRWTLRRWGWLAGAWVVPPADCYYAPAYAQWLRTGSDADGKPRDQLYYFHASWYPNQTGGKCAAPKLCRKATPADEC